jgi:prepilin-type N-terminal cleavage/methylation domain-containing protein
MNPRSAEGSKGFTLIELVVIIVVLGILAAIAIPKLFSVTEEAEKASVATMVSNLESALSIHVAKQFVDGSSIQVHNPFDDLSNIPSNYVGAQDPVTAANTPNGKWCWRPTGSWIMYNPKSSITGGWNNGGERFIIYQVQTVTEGADTVGLRLTTTDTYTYQW